MGFFMFKNFTLSLLKRKNFEHKKNRMKCVLQGIGAAFNEKRMDEVNLFKSEI